MLIHKRMVKKILLMVLCFVVLLALAVLGVNAAVTQAVSDKVISGENAEALDGFDCILVLGCYVKDDGTPSDMLADRIARGVELYDMGAAPKLLMSGDHGREDYDEVGTMKQCAMDADVPSDDIFMDHAGFSTYESLYRAKEIFGADKILIVTQEYHLYRALYIADALGIEAYGVASDQRTYVGQFSRDLREAFARVKDVFTAALQPEPTYLGEAIPISESGDATNDNKRIFV